MAIEYVYQLVYFSNIGKKKQTNFQKPSINDEIINNLNKLFVRQSISSIRTITIINKKKLICASAFLCKTLH